MDPPNSAPSLVPQNPVPLPLAADELKVVLAKNGNTNNLFTVIFDSKSDLPAAIDRLDVLLSQTTVDRFAALEYIDLRIENRGYICLQNTQCEK